MYTMEDLKTNRDAQITVASILFFVLAFPIYFSIAAGNADTDFAGAAGDYQVSGELTYGLERLAMYVLGVDHVMDMPFNSPDAPIPLTYGDVFKQTEEEYARWNFDVANTDVLLDHFVEAENECKAILAQDAVDPKTGKRIVMAHPAYDQCIKASHIFNLLDARGVISVTERQAYIGRVRTLAKACADAFVQTRAGGWSENAA